MIKDKKYIKEKIRGQRWYIQLLKNQIDEYSNLSEFNTDKKDFRYENDLLALKAAEIRLKELLQDYNMVLFAQIMRIERKIAEKQDRILSSYYNLQDYDCLFPEIDMINIRRKKINRQGQKIRKAIF